MGKDDFDPTIPGGGHLRSNKLCAELRNSNRNWITLSEALSWIAFQDVFGGVGICNRLKFSDLHEAMSDLFKLTQALYYLSDLAADGKIGMRGKYFENDEVDKFDIETNKIPEERFHDFRAFDINCDGLRRGYGVIWPGHFDDFDPPSLGIRKGFCDVHVNRSELLLYPSPSQPVAALSRATSGAALECREWLLDAFRADAGKKKNKKYFKDKALAEFNGRLSTRGFLRVWDAVAPAEGRSTPGRKS